MAKNIDGHALNQAAKAKMGDLSSREYGAKRLLEILIWMYRWRFSSARIIDELTGTLGYAAKLFRKGFIRRHPLEMAGTPGVPHFLITLTRAGWTYVEERLESDLVDTFPLTPKFPFHQLRHDLHVQKMTARQMELGIYENYRTFAELSQKFTGGVKVPDTVWIQGNTYTAVELELSIKKGREFDQTALAILDSLGGKHKRFDEYLILTPSKSIQDRYEAQFAPGAKLQIWARDQQRHWSATHMEAVPAWASDRITVQSIEL